MTSCSIRYLVGLSTIFLTAFTFVNSRYATAVEPGQPIPATFEWVAPELQPTLIAMQAMMASVPPLSDESLPQWRSIVFDPRPPLPDIGAEFRQIPGPAGAPELTVLVINAGAGKSRPGILHTHGGGYVVGSARSGLVSLQELASTLDCVVVSVDYRLAPESPFSGSVEDNYAGLSWMHAHAAELGVDPSRIAVMGESAGGGHAALLALTARARGQIPIVLQVLIYPMLDDRTASSRPVPAHIGKLVWTEEANRYGWTAFLGQPAGGDTVPVAGVPARAENLAGLPPAFIGVGAIDLFVDEDINYARRLIDAGVATELLVVPGAFHAFDVIAPDTELSRQFTAAKIAALRRAFGEAATP